MGPIKVATWHVFSTCQVMPRRLSKYLWSEVIQIFCILIFSIRKVERDMRCGRVFLTRGCVWIFWGEILRCEQCTTWILTVHSQTDTCLFSPTSNKKEKEEIGALFLRSDQRNQVFSLSQPSSSSLSLQTSNPCRLAPPSLPLKVHSNPRPSETHSAEPGKSRLRSTKLCKTRCHETLLLRRRFKPPSAAGQEGGGVWNYVLSIILLLS